MKLGFKILTIAFFVFCTSELSAQIDAEGSNWHQWRGPNADGVAHNESNPPTSWSEEKNVAWKVAIEGEGSSTPIIWEDRVYVISAVETDRKPETPVERHPATMTAPSGNIYEFKAVCLDRNTGKVIWNKTLKSAAPHEGRHDSTTYASASPTTDGEHLFVSFGSYGVFCLTLDGEVVWERDLGDMRTRRGWGEAVSPVIAEDKLVVMWDQEDQSRIFALNKSDGATAWEVERDEPTTWATPLIVKQAQRTQVIAAGTNHVRSYELKNGELNWESEPLTLNAIPSPVLDGDNVILMSGFRGNVALSLKLNGEDKNRPELNWRFQRDTPYVPSPVLTQGRLFFTKSNGAVLSCVDATTGEFIYGPKRLPELRSFYASPVATSSSVYLASRAGKTLVIKNSDEFEVVSINELDAEIDASPAIVGDKIYIRSKTHLYCIAESDSE